MGQVSEFLRRTTRGYYHWCPGCDTAHALPDGWTFDGNLTRPTFSPSFKHEWKEGDVPKVCHYVLAAGVLNFCVDSTHALRGPVPLPPLPAWMRD